MHISVSYHFPGISRQSPKFHNQKHMNLDWSCVIWDLVLFEYRALHRALVSFVLKWIFRKVISHFSSTQYNTFCSVDSKGYQISIISYQVLSKTEKDFLPENVLQAVSSVKGTRTFHIIDRLLHYLDVRGLSQNLRTSPQRAPFQKLCNSLKYKKCQSEKCSLVISYNCSKGALLHPCFSIPMESVSPYSTCFTLRLYLFNQYSNNLLHIPLCSEIQTFSPVLAPSLKKCQRETSCLANLYT